MIPTHLPGVGALFWAWDACKGWAVGGTVDGVYAWIRSGMGCVSSMAFQTGCAHTKM